MATSTGHDELLPIITEAKHWAAQVGSPVVGCEHVWLALIEREQRAGAGPQLSVGLQLPALRDALERHVRAYGTSGQSVSEPFGFTPKAFQALNQASSALQMAGVPEVELLRALLEVPEWSGYQVLDDLEVDAAALRRAVGLDPLDPAVPAPAGPRAVTLPGGSRVRACPLNSRIDGEALPDFGLYADIRWIPVGPAVVLDWPDFGVPRDALAAHSAIREAHVRLRQGQIVEVGCGAGLGRTGVVLACLAILDGIPAEAAVAWVRENYDPRAVETAEQERWVEGFPPPR